MAASADTAKAPAIAFEELKAPAIIVMEVEHIPPMMKNSRQPTFSRYEYLALASSSFIVGSFVANNAFLG